MTEVVFLSHLKTHLDTISSIDPLKRWRQKGWEAFTSLGLPTKTEEAFRYVSLRELYTTSFTSTPSSIDRSLFADAILPESLHSHLIFVNGRFIPHLSDLSALPPQTILLPLQESFSSHSSFLNNQLARFLKEEKDPFALLNLALHTEGIFFYLPPQMTIDSPIQCLHIVTGDVPQILSPRLYLVAGAMTKMQWIFQTHPLTAGIDHFHLPVCEIFLEEGASLHTTHDVSGGWHFESVRAILKKNASYHSFSTTTGGKAVRTNYRVQLKGENSETKLNGLWMLQNHDTAHTHAIVEHIAPHTRSMQHFKGVLTGVSRSSFEGKILVCDQAQKTEAYQLNNNLILSDTAVANSKPNLKVFADDVKASHGATISQLNADELFYLNTRGIAPALARRLLIGGFCREMIETIAYPSLLKKMQDRVETFLNR